jgi:hypothetical protein
VPTETATATVEVPSETAPEETVQAEETAIETEQDSDAALMNPEVTEGLTELLSRWSIFEKSGWFGFGAHGIEHPLYKKLSTLPLRSVVSGRWQGVDAAVINNIQEYIQGWKQERGIIADPDESFETYLRRVIAEILQATAQVAAQPSGA